MNLHPLTDGSRCRDPHEGKDYVSKGGVKIMTRKSTEIVYLILWELTECKKTAEDLA